MDLQFKTIASLTSIVFGLSGVANAAVIGNTHVTPSTNLAAVGPFTIGKISDGITSDASPFNGFASNASSGTITLTLDHPYDLGGFELWNDINVYREGIAHFRLDFFDPGSTLLGSSSVFLAPIGQLAPQTYTFETVSGVGRVNLVVLDSNRGLYNRIEIREVALLTAVPEPGTFALFAFGACWLIWHRRAKAPQA